MGRSFCRSSSSQNLSWVFHPVGLATPPPGVPLFPLAVGRTRSILPLNHVCEKHLPCWRFYPTIPHLKHVSATPLLVKGFLAYFTSLWERCFFWTVVFERPIYASSWFSHDTKFFLASQKPILRLVTLPPPPLLLDELALVAHLPQPFTCLSSGPPFNPLMVICSSTISF